jgi:hypothetical protein
MKFSAEINKYLVDQAFSPGLDISFSDEKYPDITRIEKILELSKNKRVIHIGCADHLPLIKEKIRNKKWLHGLLHETAEKCIGVDINQLAVDFIRTELGYKEVYCFDILSDNTLINDDSHWDYMIFGEIIEHIDNPVAFMSQVREKYIGKVDKIIVTAPNIFNLLTIKDIRNNIENINTDHRYWFSPYTLTKVLTRSGFQNFELSFNDRVKLPLFYAILRRARLFFGHKMEFKANCFSNLIITADFK